MLKKCLYIYATFIFSVTAVEACDDVVNNKEKQAVLSCDRCPNKNKPTDNGDEAPVVSMVDDDNEELEKELLFAREEDKSDNQETV